MWRRKKGRDLLRPYELQVLEAVRQRLEPPAAALFGRQVESIEMVQRHLDGREINFYPTRRGRQRHDPEIAFPNRSEDLRLATVTIVGQTGSDTARVYVVVGHLFQITFGEKPDRLGDGATLGVGTVTINADPMVPTHDVDIHERLDDLDVVLRAELESMWADGSADGHGIGSPAETYRIQLSDGEHLFLGQLDDTSFLVAPVDPPRPGVRRFWPDGELLREYPDIRSAVEDLRRTGT